MTARYVTCDNCGSRHEATPSHQGTHGEGQIYAVVCTADNLTDYYTSEGLIPQAWKRGRTEIDVITERVEATHGKGNW